MPTCILITAYFHLLQRMGQDRPGVKPLGSALWKLRETRHQVCLVEYLSLTSKNSLFKVRGRFSISHQNLKKQGVGIKASNADKVTFSYLITLIVQGFRHLHLPIHNNANQWFVKRQSLRSPLCAFALQHLCLQSLPFCCYYR